MTTPPAQRSSNERVDRVLAALRVYSEAVQILPTGEDYKYNKAFRGFPRAMKHHNDALVGVMQKVADCNFSGRRALKFEGLPTIQAKHSAVMEAVDGLHEQIDHLLDEARGDKMKAAAQLSVPFGSGGMVAPAGTNADFATKFSRHLRPQAQFEEPVDNSSAPFAPILHDPVTGKRSRGTVGVHPHQAALDALALQPAQLTAGREQLYRPLDETPLDCVDSLDGLKAVIEELAKETEVAIDLEHHSFHSYLGFTCLVQISTRTKDYVIDPIALRSHMHLLNEVFTNPAIVKVFHAAHEDIKWLQKDFGCFVVNMFDTAIALQTLHMPHSLAFCVDHFCQVKLDKTYQTADWRVRPLPPALVAYARQDTHYLLYCYDRLRAMLLSASSVSRHESHASLAIGNLLVHVWNESKRRTAILFAKDAFDPESTWAVALGKSLGGLNVTQRAVAKFVFNWRDATARADDESPPATLHTASVLSLATRLPRSARDVIRLAQPATVALRRDAAAIAAFINEAIGDDDVPPQAAPTDAGSADGALKPGAGRATQVHRPMTGTMPSVAHPVRSLDLIAAAQQSTSPVSRDGGCVDVLTAFCLRRLSTIASVTHSRVMDTITAAIPVPGVAVKRAAAAAPSRSAAPAARDSDDDGAAAVDGLAEPSTKAHRAEDVVMAAAELTAAAPSPAAVDRTALPPSLREEFGGLGRNDRRRDRGGFKAGHV